RWSQLSRKKWAKIPSFYFYCMLGTVTQLPESFWPYIQFTQIRTIIFTSNGFPKDKMHKFAECLQSTKNVYKIDLAYNKLGAAGAEELIKHLKGTNIKTIKISNNEIGEEGAVALAKHLQGTNLNK